MAYIKFLNAKSAVKCSVIPSGNNIVTLKFPENVIVNTIGFDVYLDKKMENNIGGTNYQNFKTIYRNDEETAKFNGYQLSNDGSVYVEPEPVSEPEPYIPTLDEVKEQKISEMNKVQQITIQSGVDVTLTDGTVEHFTLTDHDQTSLMGLQTQVAQGIEQIPWHNSDTTEHCKYYSNTDMAIITKTALSYVTYHVTYFRDLRIYINSMTTKEDVEFVYYGIEIPSEYQSEVLIDIYSAQSLI